MPDEGDEIALATGFDSQHAKAVVGVMEYDAVDPSRQDLRRARRQGPHHPQGPVWRQCRVGLVVDAEFGIRRRARVQDNSAAWISRSQISVNSLMWRRVCAMSSADAGFVGSRACSQGLLWSRGRQRGSSGRAHSCSGAQPAGSTDPSEGLAAARLRHRGYRSPAACRPTGLRRCPSARRSCQVMRYCRGPESAQRGMAWASIAVKERPNFIVTDGLGRWRARSASAHCSLLVPPTAVNAAVAEG